MKTNYDKEIDYSISLLENIDKVLMCSFLEDKRCTLSLILPEKMVFSENKLLNFFQNEFFSLIFLNSNELEGKKRKTSWG
jgi:hypothetical protein